MCVFLYLLYCFKICSVISSFTEHEGSLSCWKEATAVRYSDASASNSHPHTFCNATSIFSFG